MDALSNLVGLSAQDLQARAAPGTRSAREIGGPGLKEAAERFEAMMLGQIFASLRKTVQASGMMGENSGARSTYEYLLDQAVVENAMRSGKGLGLAERLQADWAAKKTR